MSLAVAAEPVRTLADCVDELVVLAGNQAGGACVWCGSRDLWAAAPHGGDTGSGECLVVTCRECGAQLVTEQPSQMRSRWT